MKHVCEYTTISVYSPGEPKRYYDVCRCGACIERSVRTVKTASDNRSNARILFNEYSTQYERPALKK